jgi:hypothetical protein
MIYKGVKVQKIETLIQENPNIIIVNIHLSNDKIFTCKSKKAIDPSIFFNAEKLGFFIVGAIASAIKELNKEME